MRTQLSASHPGLPPPTQWTVYDADRAVGWTTDHTVASRGSPIRPKPNTPRGLRTAPWERARHNAMTPSTWAALGLASLSLLVLALLVPNRLGGTLAVIGLTALAVFRAAAITGRWLPGRPRRNRGLSHPFLSTPREAHATRIRRSSLIGAKYSCWVGTSRSTGRNKGGNDRNHYDCHQRACNRGDVDRRDAEEPPGKQRRERHARDEAERRADPHGPKPLPNE